MIGGYIPPTSGPVGRELVVDFWHPTAIEMTNPRDVESALRAAANASGARVIEARFEELSPNGLTGFLLLSQSHYAIHTWPEIGYIAIDLFACGDADPRRALVELEKSFGPKYVTVTEVRRGADRQGQGRSTWWAERLYPSVSLALLINELHEQQSPWQRIATGTNAALGRVLILDDVIQVAERDAYVYHEMIAHVPLCGMKRDPKRVLIIGGGDGFLLAQVLQYPSIQSVVLVEIDAEVIRTSRSSFPGVASAFDDPRVQVVCEDGLAFVQTRPTVLFDAVLVDSPDPLGPAQVLFSREFYARARRSLVPDGVLVCQAGVPFYQREETATVTERLAEEFRRVSLFQAPVPTYVGGAMAFAIASDGAERFSRPRRAMAGLYYNRRIHAAAFVLPTWWSSLRSPAPYGKRPSGG